DFLFGIGSWQVATGKLALLVLFVILALTLYAYKKLGHDRWKIVHKFIGLALALGVVHAFYVPGEVSVIPLLRYYLLLIGLVGISAFLWRTVFQMFKRNEYEYEFVSVNNLGAEIYEVVLRPLHKKISHMPGQFAFVRIIQGAYDKKSHPFTISSSPDDQYIRFSIKALGDYTKSLAAIASGTRCRIEGPFGRFTYSTTPETHQLWVAGGIGVTPFLSMARFFKDQGSTMGYDIDMYYSGKSLEELVFLKELREIAAALKQGFRVHTFDSSKQGHLTAGIIAQEIKDVQGRDMFICGPMAMMDALSGQLVLLGLPSSKIHKEDFALR
ncbi:MAG: FAD-binding oxidoreductase, partial [Patescibacteria group bacterium]